MKSLLKTQPHELLWVQPKAKKWNYELLNKKGKKIASLVWEEEKGGCLATTNEENWLLKKGGIRKPVVSICTPDGGAAFKHSEGFGFGNYSFKFNEVSYHWQNLSFWKNKWGFVNEAGDTLMTFEGTSSKKIKVNLEIDETLDENSDRPILACIGMFILVNFSWA